MRKDVEKRISLDLLTHSKALIPGQPAPKLITEEVCRAVYSEYLSVEAVAV